MPSPRVSLGMRGPSVRWRWKRQPFCGSAYWVAESVGRCHTQISILIRSWQVAAMEKQMGAQMVTEKVGQKAAQRAQTVAFAIAPYVSKK